MFIIHLFMLMYRSQIRLQRLGDHLGSDTATGGNEEDSSINIVSDGDAPGYHAVCPQNDVQNNYSPGKKVLFVKHDTAEELAKCGNFFDMLYVQHLIIL